MNRFVVPALVFIVLVAFLAVGLRLNPTEVPSPLIGKPAPDFILPRLDDPARTISRADLLGQVSLVNVWATWCVACRAEHPVLNRLARTGEVPIYGLNWKDERDAALRWLQSLGDPYTAVAVDATGEVAIDWGVYGAPETFVVDAAGIIRYKHIGPLTDEVLQQKILPLVRELKGAPA